MTKIFLSYSRADIPLARRIDETLQARGMETWVDWSDVQPAEDQMQEYLHAIEQAEVVVVLLSSASIASPYRRREVEHAVSVQKRLIPVVLDDFDPAGVPQVLRKLNWIFLRREEEFAAAIEGLVEAIETDQDHLRAHTWYQNRALEWERSAQDKAYLLRGDGLHEAEAWYADSAGKDPAPSDLQVRFLLESRRETDRRQRLALIAASAALLLTVILGVLVWRQRNQAVQMAQVRATAESVAIHEANTRATAEAAALQEADQRATAQAQALEAEAAALDELAIANSRRLASLSASRLNADELDQALLLAVAAVTARDTEEARNSLVAALTFRPYLERILYAEADADDMFGTLAFSADGRQLAGSHDSKTIERWDVSTGQQLGAELVGSDDKISSLAYANGDQWLISGSYGREVIIWDLDSAEMLRSIFLEPRDSLGMVEALAVHEPSGLFAASVYEMIAVLDLNQKGWYTVMSDPQGRVESLAFSPDGLLVSGSRDSSFPYTDLGRVTLWDPLSGTMIGEPLPAQYKGAHSVGFSPDGTQIGAAGVRNYLVPGDHVGEIMFWDFDGETARPGQVWETDEKTYELHYAQDGARLYTSHGDEVQIWDLASGEPAGDGARIDGRALAFSPDDTHLATLGTAGKVFLWSLEMQEDGVGTLDELVQRACRIANRDLNEKEWELYVPDMPQGSICPQLD